MSILSTPYPSLIQTEPYTLAISQSRKSILIYMELNTAHFHTNNFPRTYDILKHELPSVLSTKCFNKERLPFDREVINTEIGHLFEHILLQYLCIMKLQDGSKKALYKGLTQWDWDKDRKGTFHITISVNISDWEIFPRALKKSQRLLEKVLDSPIYVSGIN